MPSIFKVTGHTLTERPGYMPAEHTDYEVVVAFERWEDNQEILENFLAWHWSIDLQANPYERSRLLTAENSARALAVFYFREQTIRFHYQSVTRFAAVPSEAPSAETKDYRLWIAKKVSKDVFTALNAGWELFVRCEAGKISVEDAKLLLRDRFPGQHFAWTDVLSAFRKQGGRHTDRYLRRH